MESWRILLDIAGTLGWNAEQSDVKTAFLHGVLPENEVQYMEIPPGFQEPGQENHVWKLKKSLYGMKQSGRVWNNMLHAAMLEWGFVALGCEPCIYYRQTSNRIIITAIHVDDFLIVSDSTNESTRFKDQIKTKWVISELGEPKYCIGIAVSRDRAQSTFSLSQTALIDRIVQQFGQYTTTTSIPITPMDPGLKLRKPDLDQLTLDQRSELSCLPYALLVGCLIYLAVGTRPDISFTVQQLSQYLTNYS
jgi:hypothetical protein